MRGRGARDWIGLAALIAIGLATLAGSAYGYFRATGSGTAAAAVGVLGAPRSLSATAGAPGSVELSWEAASAPAGGVTYYVTRNGKAAAGGCPSAAAPAEGVLACTDAGLEAGTYTYVVWARWRSWTAASAAAEATVTYGAGAYLQVTAASTKPTAGATDNLTITAKEGSGHTITGYTGEHVLTFSGAAVSPGGNAPTVVDDSGTAVEFGRPTELEFKAGVASVRSKRNGVMTLYAAGAATIAVTDGALSGESTPVTVAAKSKSQFGLEAEDDTPAAGEPDPLEVIAQDVYGNTVTSYSGNHNLVYSGAGESPGGESPTVTDRTGKSVAFGTKTSTTFVEGVARASGRSNGVMTLYAAGPTEVEVAEGSTTGGPLALTVSPGPAAALALEASSTTPTAGGTDNLTTIARDAYGNTATSYTGAHSIVFAGAEPSPSGIAATVADGSGNAVGFGSATALTFNAGVAGVSGSGNGVLRPARAGATSITASDGTISTAAPLELSVRAGTAANLAWVEPTLSAGTLGSHCLFTCTITRLGNGGTFVAAVGVTDALGNVVENLGSRHAARVTATGGTIIGGTLTIAATGPAESSAFTYRAPTSGSFTNTITATTSSGTVYTSATATVSR